MENSQNTYKAKVSCPNCGFSGEVDIPKKTMVEDNACPNCGNSGMNRIPDPVRITPRTQNYR